MRALATDPADVLAGWARPGGADALAAETAGWGPAEWARARAAALVHGVAPLLAERLAGTPAWAALDPGLRGYCAAQLDLNRRRVALLLADLAEILAAARGAGVDVLPLKGAALLAAYYADPAVRPMADLDLLARPADEPRLAAALAAIGYRLLEDKPRHRSYHRGAWRIASYDGEHPDNPRCVELHSAVEERTRQIRYDITPALWAGAAVGEYAGATGLMPAPAALLLHLLIHTSHNLLFRRLRLIQLYDLTLVAPRLAPADWERLAEHATRAGEARLLYAPLALAERALGPLAPPEIIDRLARATPAGLRRALAARLLSELSLCNPREADPAYKLAWYHPGPQWLAALARVALPSAYDLRDHYPELAGRPARAYARHIAHVAGWGLRLLTRRPRRPAVGGR